MVEWRVPTLARVAANVIEWRIHTLCRPGAQIGRVLIPPSDDLCPYMVRLGGDWRSGWCKSRRTTTASSLIAFP